MSGSMVARVRVGGRRRRFAVALCTALTALVVATVAVAPTPPTAGAASVGPSSSGVGPAIAPVLAPTLDWAPCPGRDGFDCATAVVPLDHDDPGGATIELAVIRRPAADPDHRIGALFMNPGGPGGSGVDALPFMVPLFPAEVQARFDLVSWDPRGVGASTAVQCFDTRAEEDAFLSAIPGFPVTDAQVATWIATMTEFDARCATRAGALLDHVSTVDTVHDLDWLRRAVGDDRLSYWGISYGTYLGAVYASLFPDRLRAVILDANVDPVAWNDATTTFTTGIRIGSDLGSAATMDGFLRTCGSALVTSCEFSAGTPEATAAKFDELLAILGAAPVVMPNGRTIGATELLVQIGGALGQAVPVPGLLTGWVPLAKGLQRVWEATRPGAEPLAVTAAADALEALAGPSTTEPYSGIEQFLAVICAESPNPTMDGYAAAARFALARAGVMGPRWAWENLGCGAWAGHADHTYTGPWSMPRSATPLLLNTTVDPATPLSSAIATQSAIGGRLVTVEGYGHGVLLNPSSCASAIANAYLIDGVVPSSDVTCAQDSPPFEPAPAPTPPGPEPFVPRFTG